MRPTPVKLSQEDRARFNEASRRQTSSTKTPLTIDTEKYPMFDIPVNDKRLIYVPNLTYSYTDEEGNEVTDMCMDKGAYHGVRYRGSFVRYRCTGEISGIEGFDGTCPFDSAVAECWELYNLMYADAAAKKGIDPNSEEAKDALEDDRKKLLKEFAVGGKEIFYTFPIFVVECQQGTLNPMTNPDGSIKGRLEWYAIREKTFIDKWETIFQGFPDNATHPAGKWFILDYTYQSTSGKHTKMKSASNLSVVYKAFGEDWKPIQQYIDQLAASWTPELAQDTIYYNMIYTPDALKPIVDEVMKPTRSKLQAYAAADNGNTEVVGAIGQDSPEAIMQNFGAVQAEQPTAPAGQPVAPPVGVAPTPVQQ